METHRYIIAVHKNGDILHYVGAPMSHTKNLTIVNQLFPGLDDAIFFENVEDAEREASRIHEPGLSISVLLTHVCPKCSERYVGYPAISRTDNKTAICPKCGATEAIAAWVNDRSGKD